MILSRQSIEKTIEAVKSQIDGLEQDRKVIEQEIESSSAKVQDDQIQELLHEIGVALNQSHGVLRSFQEALKSYLEQQDRNGSRLGSESEKISVSDIEDTVDVQPEFRISEENEITPEEQTSGTNSLSPSGTYTSTNEEVQGTTGNENEHIFENRQTHILASSVEGKGGCEGDDQKQMTSLEKNTKSESNTENQELQQSSNVIIIEEFASDNTRVSDSFEKDIKIDDAEECTIGTPPKRIKANDAGQRPRISISTSTSSPGKSECIISPKTQSPIRFRMSPKNSFFGKENANTMRDILEEMKREAASVQSQFRETYMTERNMILEDLSHTRMQLQQKQLQEDEMKRVQEEYRIEIEEIREQLKKKKSELETLYSELQIQKSKYNERTLLVKSLEEQIQNLEISIKNIQNERDDTHAHEIQNQQRLFIELSQENEKQKIFIDEMRDEMQRRKEVRDREISRLKQSLSDILEGENDTDFAEKDQRLQKYAEMQLMELENSSFDFHQRNIYEPEFDNDPLDYAVAEVLSSLHCPVRIEIEHLGPGEYQMDRKLKLRLINGDVMVRIGSGYEPFSRYVRNVYSPFFLGDQEEQEESSSIQLGHLESILSKYQIPSSSNRSGNVQRVKTPRSTTNLPMRIKPSHHVKNSSSDDLERSQQAIDEVRNSYQRRLLASPKESPSTRGKGQQGSPATSLPPRSINSIASGPMSNSEKDDAQRYFTSSTGPERGSPPSSSMSKRTQISPQPIGYARANNNSEKRGNNSSIEQQKSIQSHTTSLEQRIHRESPRSSSTPRSYGSHRSLLFQRSASVGKNQNNNNNPNLHQQTKKRDNLPGHSRVMRSAERPSSRMPATTPGRLLPENVGKLTEQQIRQLKRVALKKQIEQMRERNEKRRSVY